MKAEMLLSSLLLAIFGTLCHAEAEPQPEPEPGNYNTHDFHNSPFLNFNNMERFDNQGHQLFTPSRFIGDSSYGDTGNFQNTDPAYQTPENHMSQHGGSYFDQPRVGHQNVAGQFGPWNPLQNSQFQFYPSFYPQRVQPAYSNLFQQQQRPFRVNPFNDQINHPLAHIRPLNPLPAEDEPQKHPLIHTRPAESDGTPEEIPAEGGIRHEAGSTVSMPVAGLLGNTPIIGILLLQPQVPTRGSTLNNPLAWLFDNQNQNPLGGSVSPFSGHTSTTQFTHERDQQSLVSLRENKCHNGPEEGACYPATECRGKGGRPVNYCRDFSKFCCIFHLTCDDKTSEVTSYFRNQNYPLTTRLTGSCVYTVTRKSSEYCAVRIQPKSLVLPANLGYCQDAYFDVTVNGESYEPLCGNLAGESYDVPMMGADSVTLSFQTNQKTKLAWRIEVTQIKCDGGKVTSNWPTAPGDNSPQLVAHSPPMIDNTVSTPEFSQKNLQCGLSGVQRQHLDSQRQAFEDQEASAQANDRLAEPVSLNPHLTSFEWAVPELVESDLYKYKGDPVISQRITFGQFAQQNEFPWQIAMYSKGRFHCGASLISDRHVLTAAHCVRRYVHNRKFLNLAIGDYDVSNKLDGPSLSRGVSKIAVHPGYSTTTLKYDVAVVTLDSPVPLSHKVSPVCLPPYDINLEGEVPTVTGWGRDENNRLQNVLMKLSASVVDNNECDKRWATKGAYTGIITNTMMCMDPQYGDSCKGDSGGPSVLEYPHGSGVWIQVGIVSFGSATCTDKKLPGVYTRVGLVSDWVTAQMV